MIWAACLALVPAARAVVTTIDASVTAEVQETLDGTVINSDLAFKDLDDTTRNLPLVAEAKLFPPSDAASELPGVAGAARTVFRDPRLNPSDPPNEFALDLGGFSDEEGATVSGRSLAVESRDVVFGAEEVGLEPGTEVIARSHFFVDGLMILVSTPGQVDLSGARAELTLSVEQVRAEEASPATVLEASVVLTGNSDGTASLTVNGALVADNLTVLGLEPLDSSLPGFQAVSLPDLAIPYEYPARVDENFTLKARIEAKTVSGPGTGASVIIGDGLNSLVSLLADVLGEDIGDDFGDVLDGTLSALSGPARPLVAAETDTVLEVVTDAGQDAPLLGLPPTCGIMGVEGLLLAAGLTFLPLLGRRR